MAPAVVLVGLPSSGKTTVGLELAKTLGSHARLIETDSLVEHELEMPVPEIFLVHGEPVFREAERRALVLGLATSDAVLVVGSGAVDSVQNRAVLADVFVVWLNISSLDAAKRAGLTGARPVQLGNVRSQWAKLAAKREGLYEEVADLVVDTGNLDVEQCVGVILGAVDGHARRT